MIIYGDSFMILSGGSRTKNMADSWLLCASEETQSIEQQLAKLKTEKQALEADFGVKRARFKELFLQKEGVYWLQRSKCHCF